jgi:molybdate transport system substrate-binding protein
MSMYFSKKIIGIFQYAVLPAANQGNERPYVEVGSMRAIMTRTVLTIEAVAAVFSAVYAQETVPKRELTVSAAASLTDAFQKIGAEFEKRHPKVKIAYNFAASGALATQIELGAPVDVFASASDKDMDRLAGKHLLLPGTRKVFARNSLVVIVPKSSKLRVKKLADLKMDSIKRIATGNPETTPGGRYAMQALKAAGIADAIKDKLVYGADIRQARAYVVRNEVDAAIVFSTDAAIEGIRTACKIPDSLHEKITYPAAVLKASKDQSMAKDYLAFLQSRRGRAILASFGFQSPER